LGVTQACAENRRELIRVNVTIETDEDDLLGGYRLREGQTVWQNGPVIEAMERGAILLLDEIDLASNKIMCLQPILEGSGIFVKKINKYIKPLKGFNVIATANTKGQGSEDGKFIGTNVLNEAFLERFPITFEQKYPSVKIEERILIKNLEKSGKKNKDFCQKLVLGQTLSEKLILMAVLMRLSQQEDWYISYKHILSLMINKKLLKFVLIDLMMIQRIHL